jgi:homocysteine S-methyltransferase
MSTRTQLPQLADRVFLTDGGAETDLIFHGGLDLPYFAAFVLLADEPGRQALRDYFRPYAALAAGAGTGLVLETPTWRASADWGALLGYGADELDAANRAAVDLLVAVREEYETPRTPIVLSGNLGPRGDGYAPDAHLSPQEAEDYHGAQIATFADTQADLVSALTLTHTGEAIGIARAAAAQGVPCVLSFTVETDGRLPSGESLEEAVRTVDAATGATPSYYMVNCAHPTHVADALRSGSGWQDRLRGLRANASTMSHAELDAAEELDEGDPQDLAARYAGLREDLPRLTVLGGCCGTDVRHVDAIRRACVA